MKYFTGLDCCVSPPARLSLVITFLVDIKEGYSYSYTIKKLV